MFSISNVKQHAVQSRKKLQYFAHGEKRSTSHCEQLIRGEYMGCLRTLPNSSRLRYLSAASQALAAFMVPLTCTEKGFLLTTAEVALQRLKHGVKCLLEPKTLL
jgi:hypothetical protein